MIALVLLFTLCLIHAKAELNITVIKIPSIQRGASYPSVNVIQARYFYIRYQNYHQFDIGTASNTFVKVPGLDLAVNHDQPLVYRIEFQGGCQLSDIWASGYVHILIDGHVLIRNELLPNNGQRQVVAPHLGMNIDVVDKIGAGMMTPAAYPSQVNACSRSRLVYLPAGVHLIEVGIRVSKGIMSIHGGQLNVELTSYDPSVQHMLQFPIIR